MKINKTIELKLKNQSYITFGINKLIAQKEGNAKKSQKQEYSWKQRTQKLAIFTCAGRKMKVTTKLFKNENKCILQSTKHNAMFIKTKYIEMN
jgi:hypothetical protein